MLASTPREQRTATSGIEAALDLGALARVHGAGVVGDLLDHLAHLHARVRARGAARPREVEHVVHEELRALDAVPRARQGVLELRIPLAHRLEGGQAVGERRERREQIVGDAPAEHLELLGPSLDEPGVQALQAHVRPEHAPDPDGDRERQRQHHAVEDAVDDEHAPARSLDAARALRGVVGC